MKLRILGINNMLSRDTKYPAYLIDDILALDAGGLAHALSFDEQAGIRAVALSHRHLDHTLDLVPLSMNSVASGWEPVEVYGIQDTIDFLRAELLGPLVPKALDTPDGKEGPLRLNVVDPFEEVDVLGYAVTAVPVPHAVPAAGIQVDSGAVKLFYTGDAGPGLNGAWAHVSPDVLLTECSHGNDNRAHALVAGHQTPDLLKEALLDFSDMHGYLPRVLVTHINPQWEQAVRRELVEVSRELDHEIVVTAPGMTFDLEAR